MTQQELSDVYISPGLSLLELRPSVLSSGIFASAGGLLQQVLSALPGPATTLSSMNIDVRKPERFGDGDAPALSPEAVVTALAASKARTKVEVSARLIDSDGTTAMRAELAILADLPKPDALLCPGSTEWIDELGTRLRTDATFARVIEAYDGTIGLEIAGRPVHLRCYAGAVIDASADALRGPDFTVAIPGAHFIALLQADHNSFMKFAMQRRMRVYGSRYEYLRMVSALVRIFDVIREMGVATGYTNACADHVAASTLSEASRTNPTLMED